MKKILMIILILLAIFFTICFDMSVDAMIIGDIDYNLKFSKFWNHHLWRLSDQQYFIFCYSKKVTLIFQPTDSSD